VAEIGSAQADAAEGSGAVTGARGATGFMQRAVIRRRVRFLRRRRELALHDLGGFAFESHRLGESRDDLLTEKLAALSALDDELATLQRALDLREEVAVLHEPGIASCPQCSTIHDSAANYCPGCGRRSAGGPPTPARQLAADPPDAASGELTLNEPPSAGEPPATGEPLAAGVTPTAGEPE